MTDDIIQHSIQERHDNSKYKVKICGKYYPIKRFFLPLIGGFAVLILPDSRNFTYLPILMFFMSFIIYWNFPILILFTNSRPLYYEDLFIDYTKFPLIEVSPATKSKYIFFFELTIILTNSLFTAAMADYWLYQTYKEESYVEIIGITGGILKIFQIINHVNGCIVLFIIKKLIRKEIDNDVELQTIESP